MKRISLVLLFLPLLLTQPARAVDPVIENCLVVLIDDVEISAQEPGIITAVPVVEGQDIKPGELLAQIDDSQPRMQLIAAQAELAAALKKASDDIEVRYAEKARDQAVYEYEMAIELNSRQPNTVPATEVRRLQLAMERAALEIDRRELEFEVAELSAQASQAAVDSANSAIDRRRLESPLDGMVVTLFKGAGEWVQAGEPVARLMRLDRLRVEGRLSGNDYDPSTIDGRPVTVEFTLAGGRTAQLPGRVVFVSPLVQAGNLYRVRAEIDNSQVDGHWVLLPGMTATMTIKLN